MKEHEKDYRLWGQDGVGWGDASRGIWNIVRTSRKILATPLHNSLKCRCLQYYNIGPEDVLILI